MAVDQLSGRRESWGVKEEARGWTPEDTLDDHGIGLDSFDLLTVAGLVNRRFRLYELGVEEYLLARRRFTEWGEVILYAWQHQETPSIGFETSGSTGEPQLVEHELAALEEEVACFGDVFPPAERVLSYVPAHHIYGFLFTVLMPVLEGSFVVPAYLNPLQASPAAGDRLVAFPDLWRMLASQYPLSANMHGLSSTAPMPGELAHTLRSDRGVHLFEIYGSTESSGVGYREETDGPYRLLPYWRRTPGQERVLERTRPEGLHRVELADHIEWLSDTSFRPAGRVDQQVQVGGTNVSPERIAAVIREHPAVASCAVRLMKPHEGARLKAFVVPEGTLRPEGQADALSSLHHELESWIQERLPAVERPADIVIGAQLPRNEVGKLADWPLSID